MAMETIGHLKVRECAFICAHNAYMPGRWQAFQLPDARAYRRALELGVRSLEIDLRPGLRVHHGPLAHPCFGCFGLSPTFADVIDVIVAHAFEKSSLPLFLFIDNTCTDKAELDLAADILKDAFESALYTFPAPWHLTLAELRNRVIVLSHPKNTASFAWDRLVADSPYSHRMLNLPAIPENQEVAKMASASRVIRVYPKNVLISRNYDVTPWIDRCNFVSVNVNTAIGQKICVQFGDAEKVIRRSPTDLL